MSVSTPPASRQVRANRIDIHHIETGDGLPVIVLNNGMVSTNPVWNGHPAAYNTHFATFAERFRVIAPDLRGAGRTVHPGGPISYELLAEDVLALIDALGLDRPALVGFSDGGILATIVAIKSPGSVGAVVNHAGHDLFNPQAPSMTMAREIFGGAPDATEADQDHITRMAEQSPDMGSMFELMARDHDAAQGEGHWRRVIAQTFPRITQPTGYTFDDLARITAPTLILVGDRDPFCSLEEAATAYRTLKTGELAVLPNTGHGITLEAVQTAGDFLERNAAKE
jgi:pimeloyl-ACP methyl ester carboxylesterase